MRRRDLALALGILAAPLGGCGEESSSDAKPEAGPTAATSGDQAGRESPEDVAARYMAATRDCDWKACANLLHPEALIEFARLMRPMLHAAKSDESLADLGFTSKEQIDLVSPTELFMRMMSLKMKLQPELVEVYHSTKGQALGHVTEGDEVHVVCRYTATSSRGVTSSSVTVESLKLSGGEWRLLLSRELQGEAQSEVAEPDSQK